jgi:hypothetical protein
MNGMQGTAWRAETGKEMEGEGTERRVLAGRGGERCIVPLPFYKS